LTIIDTSVMIALLKGTPDAKEKIRESLNQNDLPAVTIITVYELLKGAYLSSKRQDNLTNVKEALSNMQILELSTEACEEASNIYYELYRSGQLISDFDILLQAFAKTQGQTLLTRDQHFTSIKGLNLILW